MRKFMAWSVMWFGVMVASFISKDGTKEFILGLCERINEAKK